ncbi:MAG TPA: 3'-5' exonuclease, partial [Gemmatimonadaceae bacterium]|nr:3'-5' exonuclease [Gemmatimonadaceae bacterium]
GLSEADLADAPWFEQIWERIYDFCAGDKVVAHNGYHFDFPILRRLAGEPFGSSYDTLPLARDLHPTSGKLSDLARLYGFDPGNSHRALDDTRTLARVCLALHETNVVRARKTALVTLLDHLGLALALDARERDPEAELMRNLCVPWSLGRYSDCLGFYERERELIADDSVATVEQVIEWLGGEERMQKIRAEKSADERYPAAMARLRRLIASCGSGTLGEQITAFLERVALSKADGVETASERVNLLTLHSTKGLEFSRVYILGVEDFQLPGDKERRDASKEEVEEARRLLYVRMTRAKDRLVMTRAEVRDGRPTGGHRFLSEMGLPPQAPSRRSD